MTRLLTRSSMDLKANHSMVLYHLRKKYVDKYAWAIPSHEAIVEISKHGPIIEIGAGIGYWAKLLKEEGADVVAFDIYNKDNRKHFDVQLGKPSTLRCYSNRTLFLCWPPYDEPMAKHCLDNYRGEIVIYIGEGPGGCTGCDLFHEKLHDEFSEIKFVKIPRWDHINDYMSIWKRN